MKLDLACGGVPAEGFEGVDITQVVRDGVERVKHVFDLLRFPWPFADGSVDEVRCAHFIEHIPQLFHTKDPRFPVGHELTAVAEGPHSVSLFLKFFDEIYRVLKPGGSAHIFCPHGHSDRAFWDPTHTRFIMEGTFHYLDRDWRKANNLEHAAYGISCHFPIKLRQLRGAASPEQDRELELMANDKVKDKAVERWWNMISDFDAILVKEPALVPAAESTSEGSTVDAQTKETTTAAT